MSWSLVNTIIDLVYKMLVLLVFFLVTTLMLFNWSDTVYELYARIFRFNPMESRTVCILKFIVGAILVTVALTLIMGNVRFSILKIVYYIVHL